MENEEQKWDEVKEEEEEEEEDDEVKEEEEEEEEVKEEAEEAEEEEEEEVKEEAAEEEEEEVKEEAEEEEEETTLQKRKSRSVNNNKSTEIAVIVTDLSNGTPDCNGHEFHSKVTANGANNLESTLKNEQNIEELDGIIENEDEVKNGLQESENLVFFDKDEGVDLTSIYTGEQHIEKINGHHKLDISSQEYGLHNSTSTINNNSEGVLEDDSLSYKNLQHSQISFQKHSSSYKSSKEIENAEVDLIQEDELEVTELDVERVLEKQTTHDLFCPNCNSCITRRVILRKRKRRIRISEEDIKRNKTEATGDTKSDFGSFQASSDQIHHKDDVEVGGTPILTTDNVDRNREPDVFRCFSCFSFFIPTGSGFKLFRMFDEKNVRATVRDEQVPSVKKNWFASMFASNKQETTVERGSSSRADGVKGDVGFMASNTVDQNGQPSFIQVSHSPADSSEGFLRSAGKNNALKGGDMILPFPSQGLNGKVLNGAVADKATDKRDSTMEYSEEYGADKLKESKSGGEVPVNHESDLSTKMLNKTHFTNGESAEDAISFSQLGGLKLLLSSNEGLLNIKKPEESQILNQKVQISTGGEAIQLLTTPVSVLKDVDGRVDISLAVPHEEQHVEAILLTESIIENKNANLQSSDDGRIYPTEVSQHIVTKTKFEVHTGESLKIDNIPSVKGASIIQGKDTVITIDARPVGSSQTGQVIITSAETASPLHSATQVRVVDHDRTEVRNDFEIEVIKSIVYGGLAESITSLSVVSSAAGGDAATLNILALGMANLIGGLFIICHNLWELRSDCVVQVSNQIRPVTEQRDRYKELLGRKENFTLHAIVSILSYIVFGLVAPVAYGFSFRKSDNKEFKLLAVAAASLLCIVTLAIGRAHVRRRPKPYLKSVITFVILGFMVSGVSYVAGVLVERILEKLGLFTSSSVTNLLLPQMTTPVYSGWASPY